MEIKKSGMITIAGRPNVGKSTLINALVGEKVAIVTNKPQTTRNRICAVLNKGDTQIVFMDTPGFHKPKSRLGDMMVKIVNDSVYDVDAVMLVVEPIPKVGIQEHLLIEKIKEGVAPSILVINKIDTVKKENLLAVIGAYGEEHEFDAVVPVSAKSGDGLDILLNELGKFVKEGPQLYPEGMISDQPEKQIVSEIVREKLLICLNNEVPHGIAVEITELERRENGFLNIDAVIYCEKESHKRIIIGENGSMLKKIGELSRSEIEKSLGAGAFLKTWVKIKKNWRDNQNFISSFGIYYE